MRVIERTKHRRLRDVSNKSTITLKKLKELLDSKEEVKVVCRTTGDDITDVVLQRFALMSRDNQDDINIISNQDLENMKNNLYNKETLEIPFYFVDLFCGAGGLSCGLEMAGMEAVFGTDMDKNALETFKKNHPNARSFLGPIEELSEETIMEKIGDKKIKLIAGGPPCQGFSTIGKGDPNDKKNTLFNHYCRVLDFIKPEYFIFENVTGLVAKKNRPIITAILDRFKELGYFVNIKILESQHYGVPQKRKRTILFGTRLNKKIDFPVPMFGVVKNGVTIPSCTVGDALENLRAEDGEIYNHNLEKTAIASELTRKRIEFIPEGKGIRYKRDEDAYLPDHLKIDVDWDTIKEGRLREMNLYRLDRKKYAPTINTQSHHYFHPLENRRFTSREFASFQSFPNGFVFAGAYKNQVKQIGNAVPPLMAKALGEQILKSYFSSNVLPESELSET